MQAESLPPSRQDRNSLRDHGWRRPSGVAAVALCAALFLSGCLGADGEDKPEISVRPEAAKVSDQAIELVETALAEERLKDAERLLDRIMLTDPSNLQARLLRGELILAKGNANGAMAVFSGLQDLPEVSVRAKQGLGICLLLTGAPEQAVENLEAALDADPTLWRAWNALGSYHDSQEQWAEAIEAYDLALAEQPNNAMILNNRGFSYFMQGRQSEARSDIERALRLEPDLRPAQVNLRLIHAWDGHYVRAMAGVTEKELPRVLNNIGYVAMMRGDLENAEAYLTRAMEADPTFNETAWENLARLRHMRELSAVETSERAVTPSDITAAAPRDE